MPYDRAISFYQTWVNSNYVATPFGTGALMLEPWWVERAFSLLSSIDEWHRRTAERRDARRSGL